MKRLLLCAVVLATSLYASKAYPKANLEGVTFLEKAELETLYTGATMVGQNLKFNKEVVKNFNKDGSYDGTIANGKRQIKGEWFIKEDKICSKNIKGTKCSQVYKEGEYYFSVRGEKLISKFKFK